MSATQSGEVTEALLRRYLGVPAPARLAAILRLVLQTGLQTVGAEEGSLLLFDREADDLRFAMTVGNAESEAVLLNQRVPIGSGITGLAAQRRAVQIGAPTYAGVQQPGRVEGVMAAPLLAADELVGAITAVTLVPGARFDVAAAERFGAIAVIGGVIVEQARALSRLQAVPTT